MQITGRDIMQLAVKQSISDADLISAECKQRQQKHTSESETRIQCDTQLVLSTAQQKQN